MSQIVVWLLTASYPLLVYIGMRHAEPRYLALLLALIALLRAGATRDRVWLIAGSLALLLAACTVFLNQRLPLQLYPVMINLVLLGLFALSLRHPPNIIERLARLREPALSPAGIRYTRRVTQVWCMFFLGNGTLALVTALWASPEIWALYNGLIAYLLMSLLFAIEWIVRQRVRADHGHH